jgi:hypothetical protein
MFGVQDADCTRYNHNAVVFSGKIGFYVECAFIISEIMGTE